MNNYAEISEYYDQIVEAGYYDMPGVADEYKEILGTQVKNILEIGIGTGGLTMHLKDQYKITGMDFSDPLLVIAKRKLSGTDVTLLQKDILEMSFKKPFDAAISHASIFLIIESDEGTVVESFLVTMEDIMKALKNVYDSIKNGAIFVMDFHPEHTIGKRFMSLPDNKRYEFEIKKINGMKEFYKLQQIKDSSGKIIALSTDHKSRTPLNEFSDIAKRVGFRKVEVVTIKNKYLVLTK